MKMLTVWLKKKAFRKILMNVFFACAMYILKCNELTGSTGMELNDFGTKMYQTLNSPLITPSSINKKTIALIQSKKIRLIKDQGIQFLYTQVCCVQRKKRLQKISSA